MARELISRKGQRNRAIIAAVALILGGVFSCGFPSLSSAAGADRKDSADFITNGVDVKRVVVTLNKSRTFRVDKPFTRAIVGSVEYADVLPLSDRVLYVQGKKIGTTNISLFDAEARLIGVFDIEVALDTGNLQEKIDASAGGGIQVSSSQGQVILSGIAGDAVAADRAVQIAKSLTGQGEVVNAMSVAPTQQVMLEVRFLEASRQAGRELGVNWFGKRGSQFATSGRQIVKDPNTPVDKGQVLPILEAAGGVLGGPFGTLLANVASNSNGAKLDVLLTALEQKGLLRSLAEPNLIALSGDQASFLAGGEFPVPVAQGGSNAGAISVEYKKFGVELLFKPTVLRRGVINLVIHPSVSQIDQTTSVSICNGCTPVPGLIKREAHTVVELRDGQSFAIAGLLQHVNIGDMSQLPWIGSVPVLGALFRSSAYQQRETDLVVIVTPRLVGPAVPGQRLASPLDSRLPSNDVDFFLNGQPEVKKRYEEYVTSGGGVAGPYGYMIPVEHNTNVKKK